jgi:eukaryotic-like serine/threonine-protein kinase
MPDLATGTEISGRYRVISRLGSGGMADVYLADDLQLGRQVALKLLHRRFAGDPDFVERFRQEAQAAAALTHPNIVSVYDRGDWDGTSYISMEYLPGRTLKELIRAEAPVDPRRAVSIAIQIAQAAKFAHRGGIIHRDLKPQNVMVDADDRAVVTDFGIARAGASGVTEAGSVMGTAHYVSPEQAQGSEVGPSSDVYSIGVVLYEMLTGRVPFDAETPVAIAMKHLSEPPVPPSSIAPGITADLEQTVLWALRKGPADRPQDADSLIRALDVVSENLRSSDGDSATLAFAIPAAVGAGAAATAVRQPPPIKRLSEPASDTAAESTGSQDQVPGDGESSRRKWWIAAGIAALIAIGLAAFFITRPTMVTMPLVVGKDLQTATTIIGNAGITGNPSIQRVQSTRPLDEVIRQKPLAGEQVAADGSISLVVSDGPGSTPVPAVADLSQAEATTILTKAGFKVKASQRPDSSTPAGGVIATDPTAGTNLQRGSQVILIVSSGVAQVPIPDVTGQNIEDARSALVAAGFVVSTSKQDSKTDADGSVISQSPAAGGKAAKGTTVSLVVASNTAPPSPTTVTIPDVVGKSKSDAMTKINASGLNASLVYVNATDSACTTDQNGKVIDQDPAAGGKANEGTTVKLSICQLPVIPGQ